MKQLNKLSLDYILKDIQKEVKKRKPKKIKVNKKLKKRNFKLELKNRLKSVPLLGWFIRWSYNLVRLNNLKHNLFIQQQQLLTLTTTLQQQLNEKVAHSTLIESEQKIYNLQKQLEQQLSEKVANSTFIESEQKNCNLQKQLEQQLNEKVAHSTLISAQKDIQQKLNEKVDAQTLTPPNIESFMEVKTPEFFENAQKEFHHNKEDFKDLDKSELYYSLFENAFYNHKVVLEKQKIYLKYIPKTNNEKSLHLDIGCGRGEFLTILKDNNHHTIGLDINSLEVSQLKKDGFDVHHIDMIEFLQTTDKNFSSISALQVIEHIDYKTLKEFIKLSYEKLDEKGVIILETINPNTPLAFNSFYMDETHIKPLPPQMVSFLLQYIGFKNIHIVYSTPLPKELRNKHDNTMNYHDYAVVGYKI